MQVLGGLCLRALLSVTSLSSSYFTLEFLDSRMSAPCRAWSVTKITKTQVGASTLAPISAVTHCQYELNLTALGHESSFPSYRPSCRTNDELVAFLSQHRDKNFLKSHGRENAR